MVSDHGNRPGKHNSNLRMLRRIETTTPAVTGRTQLASTHSPTHVSNVVAIREHNTTGKGAAAGDVIEASGDRIAERRSGRCQRKF